jgi:hypothetical protein
VPGASLLGENHFLKINIRWARSTLLLYSMKDQAFNKRHPRVQILMIYFHQLDSSELIRARKFEIRRIAKFCFKDILHLFRPNLFCCQSDFQNNEDVAGLTLTPLHTEILHRHSFNRHLPPTKAISININSFALYYHLGMSKRWDDLGLGD